MIVHKLFTKAEFVNFENGGGVCVCECVCVCVCVWGGVPCVHRRILGAMLRVLSNLFMSKLTDRFAYLGL